MILSSFVFAPANAYFTILGTNLRCLEKYFQLWVFQNFVGFTKVFLNSKKFLGKQLDDNAEVRLKYYLVITTFTCGGEIFLDLDGRSFEHDLSPLRYQKVTLAEGFFKFRRQCESVFNCKKTFREATKLSGGGALKILSCHNNFYMWW